MINFFKTIDHYGTSLTYPQWKNRNIIITNNLALICTCLLILLLVVHAISHQGLQVIYVGSFIILSLLSVPFFNKSGKVNTSRTLLTCCLILGTLLFTLTRKLTSVEAVSMNTFYQSRAAILVLSIIPFATIHFMERKLLAINLAIGFLGLILYDPIHTLFGVGFQQMGFVDPDYYYTNFIFVIIYLILIGCIGFFKKVMDTYEEKNEELILSLYSKNNLIENQKEELQTKGDILKQLLLEKDQDLSKVTQELIKFNHELLQYSYSISHNLRGPVARILGLVTVIKNHSSEEEKVKLLEYMLDSAQTLDSITHDLNKIMETRTDTFTIREKVIFEEEVDQIMELLATSIKKYNIRITKAFAVKEIFSAKLRMNHILFSLITNAIQYRCLDGTPEIRISTYRQNQEVVLEIKDNGRGMNLDTIGENLFKPFKRFHPDVSGKGIGLYLVKLQVERLHGSIEVRSFPEKGTTFIIHLKDWRDEHVTL